MQEKTRKSKDSHRLIGQNLQGAAEKSATYMLNGDNYDTKIMRINMRKKIGIEEIAYSTKIYIQ